MFADLVVGHRPRDSYTSRAPLAAGWVHKYIAAHGWCGGFAVRVMSAGSDISKISYSENGLSPPT